MDDTAFSVCGVPEVTTRDGDVWSVRATAAVARPSAVVAAAARAVEAEPRPASMTVPPSQGPPVLARSR
ncbi:hypothetical protein [Streptomyces aureus]|uniref:hypothetical protein n=1 Tax=Streptomyces aureus TaxID=193461 RepID=UPI0006E13911